MHFHLPKPMHGWREFAGEVGIIVIGVLIALGAEQAIEAVHSERLVRDTDYRLRSELDLNLANAYERLAINDCMKERLVRLRDQLASGSGGWKGNSIQFGGGVYEDVLPPVYRPPQRTWPQDAWRSAINSGVMNHETPANSSAYAALFTEIAALEDTQHKEGADATLLGDLAFDGPLGSPERREDLKVLAKLNAANALIIYDSRELIHDASLAHIRMSAAAKLARLNFQRRFRGNCVRDANVPLE